METQGITHNPNFIHLHKKENTELRFFCEAFSFLDSMSNTNNMLLAFSNLVKSSKDGKITWTDIPDLYSEETQENKSNYYTTLDRIYELIDQVIRKGWVTPAKTSTLLKLAMKVHEIKTEEALKGKGKTFLDKAFLPSQAWFDMAQKLIKLYKYQEENMAYHKDFQRENYLPHPDSWKVYFGTFSFIFASLIYVALG